EDLGRALVFSSEYRRDPDRDPRLRLQGARLEPAADPAPRGVEEILFRERLSLISTPGADAPGVGPAVLPAIAGSAHVVPPMIADQRVVGLLVAVRPVELAAWSEDEIEFLRTAADVSAVALQHAMLRSQLRVISAAAAEINSTRGRQDLLRRLVEAAMSVTQSTLGAAGVVEGGAMGCRENCRAGGGI